MVEKSHTAGSWQSAFEPFRAMGQRVADWFAPASEASVVKHAYEITVELPGVKAEDVDITVQENNLIVKGEKSSEREETGRTFYFSERQYGAFQRTFRLPPDADASKIDASCNDGVLNIKIAKLAPKTEQQKKIPVRQA